jgi:hypothetical protein
MFASSTRAFAPRRFAPAPSLRARRTTTATAMPVGTAVKVKSSVIVFHVPKTKGAATNLQGMQGVVDSRADDHEGIAVSATLACRVKLPVPDGSGKTFIAHLDEDELELA